MDKKTSKKILIVEDESNVRELLEQKLTEENFKVFTAGDGLEGLKLALREKPDLILLDLVMPKMDGFAMLKKIREDRWGKNAKVVVLTALHYAEQINEAFKSGIKDIMVKTDYAIHDVVRKVKEVLKE